MTDIKGRKLPPIILPGTSWSEERRRQILHIFAEEVYGAVPQKEVITAWDIMRERDVPGLGRQQKIRVILKSGEERYEYPLILWLPEVRNEKLPVALYIENKPRIPVDMGALLGKLDSGVLKYLMESQGDGMRSMMADAPQPKPCDIENGAHLPYWPVEDILRRGIATAAFYTEDIAADMVTDFENGIIGFFGGRQARGEHGWGAIAAWAYGARKAVDVLMDHPDIDGGKVAVAGHSRGGKTALWCAANDDRIQCCYANNSGCTGAALSRGKSGERLMHINTIFPYWFCEKYKEYSGREENLPVDQHMLLALLAPRPLYLASATEDFWADPVSEFLSAAEASAAYEAMGCRGLCCGELPQPGAPSHEGMIGYHVRKGGHALTKDDWMLFCDFWQKHWA